LKSKWVEPEVRDSVVEFVGYWNQQTEFPVCKMLQIIELDERKFYDWKARHGRINFHNGKIVRDFWLTEDEQNAIIEYAKSRETDGYRRMCYEMLDANIAAVSPSSVYRILQKNDLMNRFPRLNLTKKGTGFEQPTKANEHWHVDIVHLNICGTFYYLCSILDGYSRKIMSYAIGESMTEADIERIIERAKAENPEARPRIISDNGPQFVAKDFKEYVRISGFTHVKTSPYYPQSNGKIERWHRSMKNESIRQKVPLSLENARKIVGEYIVEYNEKRLHSAIGWVTPNDKFNGKAEEIWHQRDAKIAESKRNRASARKQETEQTKAREYFFQTS
jgi:putative transposase